MVIEVLTVLVTELLKQRHIYHNQIRHEGVHCYAINTKNRNYLKILHFVSKKKQKKAKVHDLDININFSFCFT